MTKLPYKAIVPMAAVAIIGAGIYGVSQASAASDTASGQSSLVQKLADTFHLDKSKVQAVFDAEHKDRAAARETKYEDSLTQAVKDGKLTADQKSKVLTEHKKLKSEMEALRMSESDSTSHEDRKAAMDKIRTESEDWSKANNIDAKWLMGGRGMMGHGGPGGRHMAEGRDGWGASSPSPSSSPIVDSN